MDSIQIAAVPTAYAADLLREQAPVVLRRWEDLCRQRIPEARHEDQILLFDEIPLFLARLIQVLRGELSADEACATDEVCREHGTQRAAETIYPMDAVSLEYRLLRKVLLEVLDEHHPADIVVHDLVTDCIESAMQQAADQYMHVQHAHIEKRAALLAEADRRKNIFVATLAHELRTPLSAIANALYILENIKLDEKALKQLGTASRQTRQLARLVQDMMDIARISEGKVELRPERLLLSEVCDESVDVVRQLIDQRGQDLICSYPPEPLHVMADRARLEQILTNLLSNAAKYSDPGTTIWLGIEQDQEMAELRVRDTGIGIDEVVLPHIFDLFMQVDPTEATSFGGLGIGLALVRRLVELHGGTIEAHSSGVGRGSEFVVRLPCVAAVP